MRWLGAPSLSIVVIPVIKFLTCMQRRDSKPKVKRHAIRSNKVIKKKTKTLLWL